ncbi:helix-turn-helix domain-containing protein [Candidatus Woesearchaeota archaeon]|nr:helix-turn-helix domain-containing protein [Candidatus Woesearchaeota archaeon]
MKSVSSIKIHDKTGKEAYSWNKFISRCHEKSSLYADFDIKRIRKNISQYEFAEKYNIPQSRVSVYEKRKNIPLYMLKKLNLPRPEYLNSENKNLKIKNPFPLKLTSSLARILAKCVGDVSIDKKKIKRENCYDFRYHNTDLNLINQFIDDIYRVFGIKLEIKLAKKRKNQLLKYYVRVPAVVGRILSIISEEIIEKNVSKILKRKFYPEFIGALFDDEGHSGDKEKKIFISNTNFRLLNDVKKMLDDLGIDSKIYKKQFKLYVRKVKSLEKFFEEIPFISIKKKKRLINLLYGEELISKDFMTKTISSVKEIKYDGYVYDITNNLETPNFILSNGVVVHNSTRASIIDTLFKRGYVRGKSINVTKFGQEIIKTFETYAPEILSKDLTRKFEKEMEKIRAKKLKKEKVLEEAKKVVTKLCKEISNSKADIGKSLAASLAETRKKESILMKCPKCGKGNLRIIRSKKTKKRFLACSAYPDCKTTWPLPQKGSIKILKTKCKECDTPKIIVYTRGRKPWTFCPNPNCPSKKETKKD